MSLRILWNPIVAKEYRSRMRTWRSPLGITIYALLLGGLGWLVFAAMSAAASASGGAAQAFSYGRGLFTFLIIFQLLLVTFIAPSLTAGAISGERERQTIDLLFCTRVRPFAIIWGKLMASMSFVLILLLVSVPIFSLVFLFGGIDADEALIAFLVTAVAALTFGSLGIFFSTISHRTIPATVAAYGAAFALLLGTLLIALLQPTRYNPAFIQQAPAPPAITYFSPLTPLVASASNGGVFPLFIRGTTTVMPAKGASTANLQSAAKTTPQPPGTVIPSGFFAGWRYWQANVTLDLGLSVLALALSTILLPPVRRFPWKQRTVAQAP